MITPKSKKAAQDVVAEIFKRGGTTRDRDHIIDCIIPIESEGRLSNVPLQIQVFEGSYGNRLVVNAYFGGDERHPIPTGDQELTTGAEIVDAVVNGFKSLLAGGR